VKQVSTSFFTSLLPGSGSSTRCFFLLLIISEMTAITQKNYMEKLIFYPGLVIMKLATLI